MDAGGRLRWVAPVTVGLLIVLTVGAFVAVQRLKREPLVIDRVEFIAEGIGPTAPKRSVFSPNGDCRRDRMLIRFRTTVSDSADVEIIGQGRVRVRTLEEGRFFKRYREHELVWDGVKDNGNVPRTGPFRVRVRMLGEGRDLVLPGKIRLHRFRATDSACPDGKVQPPGAERRYRPREATSSGTAQVSPDEAGEGGGGGGR